MVRRCTARDGQPGRGNGTGPPAGFIMNDGFNLGNRREPSIETMARLGTILLCGLLPAMLPRSAAAQVTADDVRQAIDQAVRYLKQQQLANGSWPERADHAGGVTALVTLALLNAGEPPDSPVVQNALDYLRDTNPLTTYAVSLQLMVFATAAPQRDRLIIRKYATWLHDAAHHYNTKLGPAMAWRYTPHPNSYDNSCTQFAVLALMEAERVGVSMPDALWEQVANHFRACQAANGGWAYGGGHPPTGSMTTAGTASLVIASGQVAQRRAAVVGGAVRCCGNHDDVTDWLRIESGLEWLARSFSVRNNPGSGGNILYYLYGLERVGRLTGRRFIGNHDWYREGAEYLIDMQRRGAAGQWRGRGIGEDNPIIGTSFALLFLSKGRRPVVIAKLQYGERDDWDYHPAGIPHLVKSIEASWGQQLTWQAVDWRAATTEDLQESPVLFLSGASGLPVTKREKEKLKEYIQQGGFLFAEARDGNGCDGAPFDRAFRALMAELFPDAQLRLLPPEHPVWFADGRVDPKYMRPLLGIDASCRISVVYCPKNLSCFWELSNRRTRDKLPPQVRDEVEACVQIGRNVVAYATNRQLKEKLAAIERPKEGPPVPPTDRGVLVVGNVRHAGGSDDAPRALPNLLAYLAGELRWRVRVENRRVEVTDPRLYEYPVLFIHGRHDFRWNDEERAALRRFVVNGGVLFADAICSAPQFVAAFRREMKAVFPQRSLRRIPAGDRIFRDDDGGFELDRVTINDPTGGRDRVGMRQVRIAPLLEGIDVDGRWAVIFSPYDLSCAWQNARSPQCKGYITQDAFRIGLNVMLYAMRQ